MDASALLSTGPVLFEGSVIERLKHEGVTDLDPHILNAALLFSEHGREVLRRVYADYRAIAKRAGLPVVLLTPTWRATTERLSAAGAPDIRTTSRMAVELLREAAEEGGGMDDPPVILGGLMGTKGDAYKPEEGLDAEEAQRYHTERAEALAEAGVDILMGATLPHLGEALGLARAMTATGLPAVPSFVIRASGALLDGTPLAEAIGAVEDGCDPRPLGYMVNCVHPRVLDQALRAGGGELEALLPRILGLQANTSARSPEELDALDVLDTEAPEPFAIAMVDVGRRFRFRVLGGCCGTSDTHITALANHWTRTAQK